MYPDVPYSGISWPMTQHAGVISKDVMDGLLNACMLCNGETIDAEKINEYLVKNGILTPNVRSDSNQVDAWRDYQQILSEFGLIYSTRLSKVVRLTQVAWAYLNKRISYEEMFTLQVLRYQYPNGHKSQLSPSLTESYGGNVPFTTYTEMQAMHQILIRPAVLVWQILSTLWESNERAILTLDEMQTYVVRCTQNSDVDACVSYILLARNDEKALSPMSRARRNMADWMKILNQTPLFKLSSDGATISLSSYSIKNYAEVAEICRQMADPLSFWKYSENNFKQNWFDTYGSFDDVTDWVLTM